MNAQGYRHLITGLDKVIKDVDGYIKHFDSIGETWTDESLGKAFECLMMAQEGLGWARETLEKAEADERKVGHRGH